MHEFQTFSNVKFEVENMWAKKTPRSIGRQFFLKFIKIFFRTIRCKRTNCRISTFFLQNYKKMSIFRKNCPIWQFLSKFRWFCQIFCPKLSKLIFLTVFLPKFMKKDLKNFLRTLSCKIGLCLMFRINRPKLTE